MDKTIKTRNVVKDIKVFDRQVAMTGGVRKAHTKVKEIAEQPSSGSNGEQHRSGTDYAQDKTEHGAKSIASTAGRNSKKAAEKIHDTVKDSRNTADNVKGVANKGRNAAQQGVQRAAQQTASKQAAKNATIRTAATNRQATATASKQAAANTANAAKGTIKQGAKGSVKTASKSVKTAQLTSKTAVKTTAKSSQAAAKSTRAAAKGAQVAARASMQATRASAKAAAITAKAAAKATVAFVKMAIAAVKSLVAAIAAGGWVAVAVILIICLVGLIAVSAFGIFFTGGDMGDGNPTLREVVAEANQEHQERIEQLKADNAHDDVIMSGSRAPWKEVLAVYSVKATTDPDNPTDVITLDAVHIQILKDVFWDMNRIEYHVSERETESVTITDDGKGNLIEEHEAVTVRTLYIELVPMSADDIAAQYHFSTAQLDLLHELLATNNDSMWQAVLYGIHNGSGDIVEVATSQIGNVGGQPYWSWYGFSSRVEWCACFVSWCANECGYIQAGIIPKFAGCEWQGEAWFKERNQWQERGYEPKPGDIIFFDWDADDISDHVGIVESCSNGIIHTIEGNNGDACRRASYGVNSNSIAGFGIPTYN